MSERARARACVGAKSENSNRARVRRVRREHTESGERLHACRGETNTRPHRQAETDGERDGNTSRHRARKKDRGSEVSVSLCE